MVQINVIFLGKIWGIFHVLIVGERLCGRAKPLEWVSRAASPLYLTIRNQWSRQTGPPQYKKQTASWMPWVFPILGVVVAAVLLMLIAIVVGTNEGLPRHRQYQRLFHLLIPRSSQRRWSHRPRLHLNRYSEPKAQSG